MTRLEGLRLCRHCGERDAVEMTRLEGLGLCRHCGEREAVVHLTRRAAGNPKPLQEIKRSNIKMREWVDPKP